MSITEKKIRTIIVEDELPIRDEILELAMLSEDLQVVGVGKNGKELAELLDQKKPDLAILDIELPITDTMTVLADRKNIPQIIFITAYEMYAPKAFEIAAIDFLVKPVKEERFNKALLRAINRIRVDHQNINSTKKNQKYFGFVRMIKLSPFPFIA
ncbi:MAG: response regulator [Spirochaetia bacterium]|nr:response regulator [Spirochaetia bacterium]